jgi:hypothetical protein
VLFSIESIAGRSSLKRLLVHDQEEECNMQIGAQDNVARERGGYAESV